MREQNLFIGNISKKGVFHYKFKNGQLLKKYSTNDCERCTYLVNAKNYLYGVLEINGMDEKNGGYEVAYKKDKEKLIKIDQKPSYGKGPCHIEIDKEQKNIFISNYTDGYLTILKKNNDGTFGKKIYSKVNKKRVSQLHCVKTIINDSFFVSVDLGLDLVIVYEIKGEKISEISKIQFPKGTQPRHVAICDKLIYVVTEQSCKLYTLKFENRKLRILDSISLLTNNIKQKENYTGCAIKLSKNFKNIYVTIRGTNTINVYKRKKEKIKIIQTISCGGDIPRDLELDKTNKYILVANQESNDIVIFKRNRLNGKLRYWDKEEVMGPTCIIVE